MKRFVSYALILLCSVLLTTTPLQAQPTPPDVADTTAEVLEVATESAETIGVAAFVSIVVSLAVLVIVVGFVSGLLIFVYKGGLKPVYELVDKANKRADAERQERLDTELALTEYRERQARAALVQTEAAERQATASERLAETMTKIETREEAQKERRTAVEAIQTTITESVEPVAGDVKAMRAQLDEAVTTLKDATERISSFASKQDLEDELRPITNELKAVTQRLSSLELRLKPDPAAGVDAPPNEVTEGKS